MWLLISARSVNSAVNRLNKILIWIRKDLTIIHQLIHWKFSFASSFGATKSQSPTLTYFHLASISLLIEIWLILFSCSGLRLTINGSAVCRFKDFQDNSLFKKDTTFFGEEKYLTKSFYLFGSSSDDLKEFKPGTFEYSFWYKIPIHVPSSAKSKYGKVRYSVEANLQTNWEFDIYARSSFTVIRFEDLSNRLELMKPINRETVATFCCWSCKSKPLILHASIPFSGYVPEQNIRIAIRITNSCGFDVDRTIIALKKVFTFISSRPEVRVVSESKTLLKNVIEGARSGAVPTKLTGIIEVPAFTMPTSNDLVSGVVRINYFIRVSVDVVGFLRRPKIEIPIVIGSKPLKFSNKIL